MTLTDLGDAVHGAHRHAVDVHGCGWPAHVGDIEGERARVGESLFGEAPQSRRGVSELTRELVDVLGVMAVSRMVSNADIFQMADRVSS